MSHHIKTAIPRRRAKKPMLKPMPAAQPSLEARNGEEEFALLVNSLPGHPKKSISCPGHFMQTYIYALEAISEAVWTVLLISDVELGCGTD
jgi:hypothetical protein